MTADDDNNLHSTQLSQLLKNPRVLFAGYKIPHPLEHTFVLKIQTTPDTNPLEVLLAESAAIIREVSDLNRKFQVHSAISTELNSGCWILKVCHILALSFGFDSVLEYYTL
ncbi:hypothetical protein BDR26DRAFT_868570 [Obelidium mucronatum]|nr:hypothetical protein BDR26DRAFT_868570 [Obelidium mucronatum]